MRSQALSREASRVGVVRAALLIVLVGLSARAIHLSLIDGRGLLRGEGQTRAALRLPPARGLIVDRSGVELALTVEAPSIYVLPAAVSNLGATSNMLSRELGVPAKQLRQRLGARDRFTFVARWVSEEKAQRIEALELAGVGVVREPRRAYPAGTLAAQLVGFANIDGEGVRGIEQKENAWLRGSARIASVERDGSGRLLVRDAVAPSDSSGGDVALTIDATMQAVAEDALRRSMDRTGAKGAVVLTLDPRSGEILALAEAPGFDPNRFREVDYAHTRSRAFVDAFEPGSTLKVFLVAGSLEAGVIRASDLLDCSEVTLEASGRTFRDRRDYGMLDLTGVVRVSSNVGAVLIAQRLGPGGHHQILQDFGFGSVTGTGFPVESAGLLRPWHTWTPLEHATIAFGQGIGVTPIQLAAATAALANGGVWMRPRLIAARRSATGGWQPTHPERVRRVISERTAASVLTMMESVVGPSGTGRRAALRNVRVAGKTGTAQKFDREAGHYSSDRYIAWFIGAVPADNPRLVIVVALDEPDGDVHGGGAVAAPLFGEVASAQLASLGIITAPEPIAAAKPLIVRRVSPARKARAPSTAEIDERPRSDERFVLAKDGDRIVLPDFRGLSMSEVLQITTANSLELQVRGRGQAVEQEPLPGTILVGSDRRIWVRFAQGRGEG